MISIYILLRQERKEPHDRQGSWGSFRGEQQNQGSRNIKMVLVGRVSTDIKCLPWLYSRVVLWSFFFVTLSPEGVPVEHGCVQGPLADLP